jgi:hypothetical protein
MPRCKPGDLAIITYDVPSCTANIGRVVQVSGPAAIDFNGRLTWLIQPVTLEPYMINDWDGEFARFMDYQESTIEHPDTWMTPIRPDDLDEDTDQQEDVTREKEVVTCR